MIVEDKILISWNEIENLVNLINKKTDQDIGNEIGIIGLSRGGLIPAVMLSELKKTESVFSIGVKNKNNIYQFPDRDRLKKFKKLYLIDDISDTGETLNFISNFVRNVNYKTISLFYRENNLFVPDYFGASIKEEWIIFPWETNINKD